MMLFVRLPANLLMLMTSFSDFYPCFLKPADAYDVVCPFATKPTDADDAICRFFSCAYKNLLMLS